MLSLKSLSHSYQKGQRLIFPDWEVEPEAHWLLLGASGSGKSTLMHILSGLLKPDDGQVILLEQDLYGMSSQKTDHFRGQHIGIVFQQPHLVRSLTVYENLEMASAMAGLKPNHSHNQALLNDLGLTAKRKSYPDELSQGQLQRVSVARALVNKPELLIADEPTSSLDHANAEQVLDLLTTQAIKNHAALIIATHDQRAGQYISNTFLI